MTKDYPPSGVLFSNNKKKTEKQPDFTGDLELSDEVVNDLVDQMSRGITKPKLSMAGWKKVSRNGLHFMSLVGSVPREKPQNSYDSTNNNDPAPGGSGFGNSDDDKIPF